MKSYKNLGDEMFDEVRDRVFTYTPVGVMRCAAYLDYYGGKPNNPPPDKLELTRDQELILWRTRGKGRAKAREQLVKAYLPWAFKMASKMKGPRLQFNDAVSAANAGLMEAMGGFDVEKGYRFTTYSAFIIRRHVMDALLATYPVRTPDRLRRKLGDPDLKAEDVKAGDPKSLTELFDRLSKSTIFDLEALLEANKDLPCLPQSIESPSEAYEMKQLSEELTNALQEALSELERHIIMRRHYRTPPQPVKAIGKEFRLSKDTVQRIHGEALQKLKAYLSK